MLVKRRYEFEACRYRVTKCQRPASGSDSVVVQKRIPDQDRNIQNLIQIGVIASAKLCVRQVNVARTEPHKFRKIPFVDQTLDRRSLYYNIKIIPETFSVEALWRCGEPQMLGS